MTNGTERFITLTITERSELEHQLDTAVAQLLEPARKLNQGVLVTRCSPSSFTVCLSKEVPYGMTVESVTW